VPRQQLSPTPFSLFKKIPAKLLVVGNKLIEELSFELLILSDLVVHQAPEFQKIVQLLPMLGQKHRGTYDLVVRAEQRYRHRGIVLYSDLMNELHVAMGNFAIAHDELSMEIGLGCLHFPQRTGKRKGALLIQEFSLFGGQHTPALDFRRFY
jgi:hypothetical protein